MNSIFINNIIDLLNNNIKNKKNQIDNLYKLNKLYLNSIIINNTNIIYNDDYEILNQYLFYLSIYFNNFNKQKIPIIPLEFQIKIIDYLEYNDIIIQKLNNEINHNLSIINNYV
jgi:hypothetical protein